MLILLVTALLLIHNGQQARVNSKDWTVYLMIPGRVILLTAAAAMVLSCAAAPCGAELPPHAEYPSKLVNLRTAYALGYGQNVKIGVGESGFGVADRIQVSTNTMFDFLTFLNGEIKLSLLKDRPSLPALAVSVGYFELVTSDLIIDTVVHEAFADEDMALDSGLEAVILSITASKKIGRRLRAHLSYQYYHLEGHVRTESPFTLSTDDGDMGLDLYLSQTAHHSCILSAIDLDLIEHIKLMVEAGYDFERSSGRGAAAFRFGIMRNFAIQAGIIWPGLELDEEIDVPVLPHFSFFWRF